MSRFMAAALALTLASCATALPLRSSLEQDYLALLGSFDPVHAGYATDHALRTEDHHPMTYALVLHAEARRFGATGDPEARTRAVAAAVWLLENSDLDSDGLRGWGFPGPLDNFGDGTRNPPNEPGTVTTALAIPALLELGNSLPSGDPLRARIGAVVAEVTLHWSRQLFRERGEGGYFPFTSNPADDVFVINATSLFVGAAAEAARTGWVPLDERERTLILDRAARAASAVIGEARIHEGKPFWLYSPEHPKETRREAQNDLLHHVYTLVGLSRYSRATGVPLPWSDRQLADSIDAFWRDGEPKYWAELPWKEPGKSLEQPARLWSAGAMIEGYARFGACGEAIRTSRVISGMYGNPTTMTIRPDGEKESQRHAAHVLLGLSELLWTGSPCL